MDNNQQMRGNTMSKQLGKNAEQLAKDYLVEHGLQWVTSNYHSRFGEIDLVMRDNLHLVFIEVRARSSISFGGAAASVTDTKRKKIMRTASHYLLAHKINHAQATRFDVICIEGKKGINWIKNAFGLDY